MHQQPSHGSIAHEGQGLCSRAVQHRASGMQSNTVAVLLLQSHHASSSYHKQHQAALFSAFASVPAGMEVSLPRIAAGIKFSWPIYKSGFQVLIDSKMETSSVWTFAEAFHWSVWLAMGATAAIVSVVVAGAERLTYGNRANRTGLRGWSWYIIGGLVQVMQRMAWVRRTQRTTCRTPFASLSYTYRLAQQNGG